MAKRTEISTLGKFGLIDRFASRFAEQNTSSHSSVGINSAVGDFVGETTVVATVLFTEGVDFDLTCFPLKHLGWKTVVAACSAVLAKGGRAQQVLLSLGISARFSVEMIDEFAEGVEAAAGAYHVDLSAVNLSASINGFTIAATSVGSVAKEQLVGIDGAHKNDVVCLTGDLGAAYMGLKLLERERIAFDGHPSPNPDFKGKEYILGRYLRPELRVDVLEQLSLEGVVPSAMTVVADGLSSDMLQICKASVCGVRLYLDRLAIASQTHEFADEIGADPVVAALNGGNDYELLFTVPLADQPKVARIGCIDFIGHITDAERGTVMVTPDGSEIALSAPGFVRKRE
ncbi:MAG: thiamine-phosphate kinase [Tidjanibacter sp.]|nr:thiamine-phosphate kinase [Tidjanibacter sp.]